MNKRGKSIIALSEIFLLVSIVFSISFFSQTSLVSAALGPPSDPATNMPLGTDSYRTAIEGASEQTITVGKDVFEGAQVFTQNGQQYAASGSKLFQFKNGIWVESGKSRYYEESFFGIFKTGNFLYGNLLQGLQWAGVVVGAIQLVGGLLGLEEQLSNSLSIAAASGIIGGKLLYGLYGQGSSTTLGAQGTLGNFLTSGQAIGIGIGIAVVVFALTYKKESTKKVTLECLPWEAPLGGARCEECNGDPSKPCSEYRCKSLGQACDIVNKGTSEEQCTWVNRDDTTPPIIKPFEDALTPGHKYSNDDELPPSLGSKVTLENGDCLKPFTPLEIGVSTDEPAQCKIDSVRSNSTKAFDGMAYYFGDSFYRYNHTEKFNLPSPDAINSEAADAPELQTDGTYNFYVRCRDANGNENVRDYNFKICVDPSPDTTPPVIVDTSILSGSYVGFGVDSVPVEVYTNEPSECRWSIMDKTYEDMEEQMTCSNKVYELNARLLYTCSTTLTGVKDKSDNNFYFRCKDQPTKPENERNVNTQSNVFVLKGSQPLTISKVIPNGTIFGSTESVKVSLGVETRDGSVDGESTCYFSPSGNENSYIAMFETGGHSHNQTLSLTSGDYKYYFRCVDAGGNAATNFTEFSVFVDKTPPMVTRAYQDNGLKIVTDEDAECSYSLNTCNFAIDEGLEMIYSNPSIRTNHYAKWEPNQAYYIKCRDLYGNEPAPNECSIIASASNAK